MNFSENDTAEICNTRESNGARARVPRLMMSLVNGRLGGEITVVSVFGDLTVQQLWRLIDASGHAHKVALIKRIQRPNHRRLDVYIRAPVDKLLWGRIVACRADPQILEIKWRLGVWPPKHRHNFRHGKGGKGFLIERSEKEGSRYTTPTADVFGRRRVVFATWNVSGLSVKLKDVWDWLRKTNVDILCVQETREKVGQDLRIPGYSWFSTPGRGRNHHWGVGIYVREFLVPFVEVVDVVKSEQVWLRFAPLDGSPRGSILGCVYVSPNGDSRLRMRLLRARMRSLKRRDDIVAVMGDFNHQSCRLWKKCEKYMTGNIAKSLAKKRVTKRVDRLMDAMELYFGTYGCSPASSRRSLEEEPEYAIDHIMLAKSPSLVCRVTVRKSDLSDHCPVVGVIRSRPLDVFKLGEKAKDPLDGVGSVKRPWVECGVNIPAFKWRRNNFCKLAMESLQANGSAFHALEREGSWHDWVSTVNESLLETRGARTGRRNVNANHIHSVWNDGDIRKARALRRKSAGALVRLRKEIAVRGYSRSMEERVKCVVSGFVKARNQYKRLVKLRQKAGSEAQWKILSETALKDPGQLFYKARQLGILGSKNGNLGNEITLMARTGRRVSGEDVLHVWRDHFGSLASQVTSDEIDLEDRNFVEANIEGLPEGDLTKELSLPDLLRQLTKLPNGKAAGPDNLPYEFYKALRPRDNSGAVDLSAEPGPVLTSLLRIMNSALRTGVIPSAWKQNYLVPVYKSGGKFDPGNYRGIALMPCVLKILQGVITDRLVSELESKNFFVPEQLGFRRGCSCTEQVGVLLDVVKRRLKMGLSTNVCFIDLKKAYDSVQPNALWRKLVAAGVSKDYIRFMQAVYEGQLVAVKQGGRISDPYNYSVGLLQGAIESPILFCVFINDMLFDIYRKGNLVGIPDVSITPLAPDGSRRSGMAGCLLADDIALLSSSDGMCQAQCDLVGVWCERWSMKIGIEKCGVVKFVKERDVTSGAVEPGRRPLLAGEKVPVLDSYTYLGIVVNRSMFESGESSGASHQRWRAAQLLRSRWGIKDVLARSCRIPVHIKLRVLRSVLLPSALYGAEVTVHNATIQLELQKIFDEGIRLAFGQRARSSHTAVLRRESCVKSLYAYTRQRQAISIMKWTAKNRDNFWSAALLQQAGESESDRGVFGYILRWFRVQLGVRSLKDLDNTAIKNLIDKSEVDRWERTRESKYASAAWYNTGGFFGGYDKQAKGKSGFILRASSLSGDGVRLFIGMRTNAFMTIPRLINGRQLRASFPKLCICDMEGSVETTAHVLLHCGAHKDWRPIWSSLLLKHYKFRHDVVDRWRALSDERKAQIILGGKWDEPRSDLIPEPRAANKDVVKSIDGNSEMMKKTILFLEGTSKRREVFLRNESKK